MQPMMIYWQSVVPQHVSGVAWSSQATSFSQCTHPATRLSGTTTATVRTEYHRQWLAVCSPDDGCKDARNILRNNWLPINHNWLHLVGLTFIYWSKMHGHSNIEKVIKYEGWNFNSGNYLFTTDTK